MAAFNALEPQINLWLLEKLLALGCVRGRLEANGEAGHLSISGQKANGQPVFSLVSDPKFGALVNEYLYAHDMPSRVQLFIEVDAEQATFRYSNVSKTERAAAQQADHQQETETLKQRPRRTTPYGPELAAQVANALRQGRQLTRYHRDYCGMGLNYHNGHYRYGEVWDGELVEPTRTFDSNDAFVSWLTQQSDKSLARLEEKDSWYWDNQTITRQQLEEFIR